MTRLTLAEILDSYHQIIRSLGGSMGVRDLGGLESAISQSNLTRQWEYIELLDIQIRDKPILYNLLQATIVLYNLLQHKTYTPD
jgi:hypothetical protein